MLRQPSTLLGQLRYLKYYSSRSACSLSQRTYFLDIQFALPVFCCVVVFCARMTMLVALNCTAYSHLLFPILVQSKTGIVVFVNK